MTFLDFLYLYLLTGFCFVGWGVGSGQYEFGKREVTYLRSGDKPAITKQTRQIPEQVVMMLLTVFGWPIQAGFWLIYVPIHDYFAGKAWKKFLAEHPEYPRSTP